MTEIIAYLGFIFHSGVAYILVSLFFVAATIYFLMLARKTYLYVRDIRNLTIIKLGYDQKTPKHIRDQVLREYEEADER